MDNVFMSQIYTHRSFKNDRAFAKYIDKLKHTAPSFDLLWDIAELPKLLELVYIYNNSESNANFDLYAPVSKTDDENRFIIQTDDYSLVVNLERYDKIISIMLKRKKGSKLDSKFVFKDGEGSEYLQDEHDEHLFETIENIIINEVINILEFYYYSDAKYFTI